MIRALHISLSIIVLLTLAASTYAAEHPSDSNDPAVQSPPKDGLLQTLGLDQEYLGLHGYLETRHYLDIKKDTRFEHNYEIRNNAMLSKELRLSPELSGLASVDMRFYILRNDIDGFQTADERIRLRELYADYAGNNFDLRIGQQIIRWGKSDEVNPTDTFTPEDLTEFFNYVERAKRKVPVLAAKHVSYWQLFSLEAIWIPFFNKTRIDEAGGDWEPYLYRFYRNMGLRMRDDSGPSEDLKNSTYAVRLLHEADNYDFSLSYSYHFQEIPALELEPIVREVAPGISVPTFDINPVYPRQHTIGGDFETVIGRIGIRGEAAYTTDKSFLSYDPAVTSGILYRDAFDCVIGADYTFKNNLYVNLQYALQTILDYPAELQTQEFEDSIVWRVTKDFKHDTVTLKSTGRYYMSTQDAVVECSIEYDITDALNLSSGIFLYYGDENTHLIGQFNKNDQVYTRLKYSF